MKRLILLTALFVFAMVGSAMAQATEDSATVTVTVANAAGWDPGAGIADYLFEITDVVLAMSPPSILVSNTLTWFNNGDVDIDGELTFPGSGTVWGAWNLDYEGMNIIGYGSFPVYNGGDSTCPVALTLTGMDYGNTDPDATYDIGTLTFTLNP